jgi:hypothetical protein
MVYTLPISGIDDTDIAPGVVVELAHPFFYSHV